MLDRSCLQREIYDYLCNRTTRRGGRATVRELARALKVNPADHVAFEEFISELAADHMLLRPCDDRKGVELGDSWRESCEEGAKPIFR